MSNNTPETLRLARMTDKQPDALALADALETFHNPHDKQAADELRRLYFENEKLRAALAEPAEQEAVAWQWLDSHIFRKHLPKNAEPGAWRPVYAAPQPAKPAEQEPVAHDEDLLERLYWEFDHQRKKTGEERMAFKGKMRFYASDFRRVSEGGAAFAQSVTDDMMNLADRLGSEYADVDPRAWKHLLVYAPKPAEQEPVAWIDITDEGHIVSSPRMYSDGSREERPLYTAPQPAKQPLTDEQLWANDEIMALNADLGWHMDTIKMFARAIERAHGIGKHE